MNSASRNLDNQLKTRRKVAKMLIAVVIMFSINFFPVHFLPVLQVCVLFLGVPSDPKMAKVLPFATLVLACFVINSLFPDISPFQFIVDKTVEAESTKENWILFFQTAAIITHCMCYFNSAINPIIYYFMSAQFKVSL